MKYTYEQTLDLLKEIVFSRGEDYVYPYASHQWDAPCRYYERDDLEGPWYPSCLVGHVFDRVMDEDTIATVISLYNTAGITEASISHLVSRFFDDKSISLLNAVQRRQDRGAPWGESVRITDSRVRQLRDITPDED